MIGDPRALALAQRDLEHLETFLPLVPRRRGRVQAGGSLGVFPARLARDFDAVYTFEPAPDLFPLLVANAPQRNVVRFQAALGRHIGGTVTTVAARRDGKPNFNAGCTHAVEGGIVPQVALDQLKLPAIDLIYLDVEGWEARALCGAIGTIERCRPAIVVEVNRNIDLVDDPGGADALRALLAGCGYRHTLTCRSDALYLPEAA